MFIDYTTLVKEAKLESTAVVSWQNGEMGGQELYEVQ